MDKNYYDRSLDLHKLLKGKLTVNSKLMVSSLDDLSLVYTPGVASPCEEIHKDIKNAYTYTMKQNTVAVVSDGTAVLGLGDIGPHAAIPVMEGKAILFKQFANIDAFPICLDTQDSNKIIETVRNIAPVFGGVNLEDISAPRCFEIEEKLQDLGIPVFHDDQHGTAIVILAGLLNACKILNKNINDLKIVVNGAGAAGLSIAKLLTHNISFNNKTIHVKNVTVCDSKGTIHPQREDLNKIKKQLLPITNPENITGNLKVAIQGADVFIGLSRGNIINANDVKTMNKDCVIFAMANPHPEIMPDEAKRGGAKIIGTGRSDFPNQINNVLAFPGIFRGALDARATQITEKMKIATAFALAESVQNPNENFIVPNPLDTRVAPIVAQAVSKAWKEGND